MESIVWIGKHGLNPVDGVTSCFPNASLGMTTVYDPEYRAREYVLRMPTNYWGMLHAFLEWMQVGMEYRRQGFVPLKNNKSSQTSSLIPW